MRNTGWKEYTEYDSEPSEYMSGICFGRMKVGPLWEAYQRAEKRGLCLIDCHINCKCERRRA